MAETSRYKVHVNYEGGHCDVYDYERYTSAVKKFDALRYGETCSVRSVYLLHNRAGRWYTEAMWAPLDK